MKKANWVECPSASLPLTAGERRKQADKHVPLSSNKKLMNFKRQILPAWLRAKSSAKCISTENKLSKNPNFGGFFFLIFD